MTLFSDWAPNYIERGYSVIPIEKKLKRPAFKEWSRFCKKRPTEEDLASWEKSAKMAQGNIGLCLGEASGVMAIDFDYELSDAKQVENMILGILPPIAVAKKGQKGWTAFFKFNPEIHSQTIDKSFEGSKKERLVDVLCDGRQTVIPPSIHPNTEKKYFWTTPDTLEDLDPEELPEISVDMISAIREICKIQKNDDYQAIGSAKAVGRHDAVFGHVIRRINAYDDMDSMVDDMIEFDKHRHKSHPKGPYFEDENYLRGKSPRNFVTALATRIADYKRKKSDEKGGDPWEFGQDTEWPSKQNGFFSTWVSEDGKRKKQVPNFLDMANYFKKELRFVSDDSQMFIWENSHYRSISKMGLESTILDLTKGLGQPRHINEFAKYIKPFCYQDIGSLKAPEGKINLKSGVLDMNTGRLQKHTPDLFFQYCLPHNFNPDAECDKWLEFLDNVFLGDKSLSSVMGEIFGYCMSGGSPWLHKAFFLYGEGRNGKSTLLEVLEAVLGESNVCNIPIESLGKPFSAVMSQGKLANIVGEMTKGEVQSSVFKTAVGGEKIVASHKGMAEFSLNFKPKMVFACNHLPILKDSSSGAYEKVFIVPFKRYFTENERIPDFAKNHLFPEIPGIINWAIEGYSRLLKRKKLPEIAAVQNEFTEYRKESDSVAAWFSEECSLEKEALSYKIHLRSLFTFYENWCEKERCRPVSPLSFSKRLAADLRRAESLGKIGEEVGDAKVVYGDYSACVKRDKDGTYTRYIVRRIPVNTLSYNSISRNFPSSS